MKMNKDQLSKICKILSDENVAHDINGYAKAPPSFRVWAGVPLNLQILNYYSLG